VAHPNPMNLPYSAHYLMEQELLNLLDVVESQGEADWQLFLSYAEQLHVAAGHVLIRQDDCDRTVYVLSEGAAEVSIASDGDADPVVVATVQPVAIFGEQTFLDGKPRSATMTTTTDSVIHRITLDAFDKMRVEEPEIAGAFLFDVARSLSLRARSLQGG